MATRTLIRVAAAALFVVPVAHALLSRVPDIADGPIVSDRLGWPARSVPLVNLASDEGRVTARLDLRIETVDPLLVHDEIHVLFATYAERPRLIEARLRVSPSCTYVAPPDARLVDNQYLQFLRGGDCSTAPITAPTPLELTVVFEDADRVAVWTYVPPPGVGEADTQPVVMADGTTAFLRGRYVDRRNPIGPQRIDLLNYVWQIADRPLWIWTAIATATGLALAGLFVFPWSSAPRDAGAFVARGAVGGFCFAAALGTLYAVLVPPFQAPDEPDHLLSYANLTEEPTLAEEAAVLARLGHLERIKFHTAEKFRPANVGHPYPEAWASYVFAADVTARSLTTTALFTQLGRVLRGRTPSQVILAARLVNALLFALAVGCGALLVGVAGGRPFPQLASLPYLLVPTLPFFGMMLSEFAVLTALYVLLASCLVALFIDGPRSHLLGLALGVCAALVFASGRSAGPMSAVVAAAAAARVVLGSPGRRTLRALARDAALFWGGLGAGVLVFARLATPAYREHVLQSLRTGPVSDLMSALLQQPLWLLPMLCAAVLIEVICRVASRPGDQARMVWVCDLVALLPLGVALATTGVAAVSLFASLPHLEPVEISQPSGLRSYVVSVLTVLGTSVRFGPPDHLLVASFWSGFGWIDTLPPPFLTTGLVLLSGVAAVVLMVYLARRRDTRRIVWLSLMGAGWIGALASYAAVSYVMQRNLHGRYLIGFHLSVLAVVWSASVFLPRYRIRPWRVATSQPALRPVLLLLACAAVHAYCLRVILTRYF